MSLNEPENSIRKQFPKVFEGLGNLGEEFTIKLKPDATLTSRRSPKSQQMPQNMDWEQVYCKRQILAVEKQVASCSRDSRGVMGLYSSKDGVTASDFESGTTPTLEIRRAIFDTSQSSLNVEGEKPSVPVNAKELKTKQLNVR